MPTMVDDRILVNNLKKKLSGAIEVRELDAALKAPEFAEDIIQAFHDNIHKEVIH